MREEDKHLTTFMTEWGRYRYRMAPHGCAPSNDGHSRCHNEIIESVVRKATIAGTTVMWDADQDLEVHWRRVYDYLALVGNNGIALNADNFQFCDKVVDFAGFRLSTRRIEPAPQHMEPIAAFPTQKSISDVRSWCDLVNQAAHYEQLRDTVSHLRTSLHDLQFHWTTKLDESFHESKQAVLEAIKWGMETFDLSRTTKLCAEYAEEGLGFYLAQKHCECEEEGTEPDPSCCGNGWKLTLTGSRPLETGEEQCTWLEGKCLAVAWALERTKHFTLDCRKLLVVVDRGSAREVLGNTAMEDIANPKLRQLRERVLPWVFLFAHGSSATNHVAGWMARNPAKTPGEDERSNPIPVSALRSKIPATPPTRITTTRRSSTNTTTTRTATHSRTTTTHTRATPPTRITTTRKSSTNTTTTSTATTTTTTTTHTRATPPTRTTTSRRSSTNTTTTSTETHST